MIKVESKEGRIKRIYEEVIAIGEKFTKVIDVNDSCKTRYLFERVRKPAMVRGEEIWERERKRWLGYSFDRLLWVKKQNV